MVFVYLGSPRAKWVQEETVAEKYPSITVLLTDRRILATFLKRKYLILKRQTNKGNFSLKMTNKHKTQTRSKSSRAMSNWNKLATAVKVGKFAYRTIKKLGKRPMSGQGSGSRKNYKGMGSKTQTGHKYTHNLTVAVHDEIKRRYTHIWMNKKGKRSYRKNKGMWKVMDQGNFKLSSNEGQQGCSEMWFCTSNNFISSSGIGYSPLTQLKDCLFDLNPYQNFSGGGVYTAGVTPPDDRLCMDKVRYKFEIANMSSASAHVECYILTPKVNCQASPLGLWLLGLQSQAGGLPAATQMTAAAGYSPGYLSPYYLDERPDYVPEFYKTFKILAKEHYDLAGGANVVQTFEFEYGGKNIDKHYLIDCSNQFVKNISVSFLWIVRGVVVEDVSTITAPNAPSVPGLTISNCNVGIVYSREFICHASSPNRVKTQIAYPRILTGGVIANEKIDNVVDTVTNIVSAI